MFMTGVLVGVVLAVEDVFDAFRDNGDRSKVFDWEDYYYYVRLGYRRYEIFFHDLDPYRR